MTLDQIKKLYELRQTPMTGKQIMLELGITRNCMDYHIKKHKMPVRPVIKYAARNAKIRQMYQAGHTLEKIAEDVGLSSSGVGHVLRKLGVAGVRRERVRVPVPAKAPVKAVQEPVAAPVTLEERILATKGRYRDLCAIADAEDMTLTAVTYRWHKLRPMPVDGWRG